MRTLTLLILATLAVAAVEIDLDWNNNTEPDLDHYRIYRSTGTTVGVSTANRVGSNLGASAWTDTGVAAGTTYSYVVTAVDTSGNESLASNTVTVTTPAAPPPAARDAFARIEAESFDAKQGIGIYNGGSGQKIGSIENGTWARYDNVDFGSGGVGSIVARVSSKNSGGTIEYRLGSTTGTLLGTTQVPGTGGWNTFTTITSSVQASTSGTETLFLEFKGGGGALLDVDWFHFETGSVAPPNGAPNAGFTASTSGLTASVNAGGSSDPDGDSLSYSWSWGDGTSGSGKSASHTYASAGTYSVKLTVSDGDLSDSATKSITVEAPTTPPATGIEGTWLLTNVGQSGQSLNAEGTANRTNIGAEPTDGGDDTQVFEVIATGGGWYKLISLASGKAVECWDWSPADGDSVSLYADNGLDWQRWRFETQADGSFAIIGKYNTRPMTLEGGDVACRDEAGLATQRWRLVAPGGSAPPPPSNQAPNASLTISTDDLMVAADGSGSSDPDGDGLSYSWNWGDGSGGSGGSGLSANHSYASAGTYTVTLTVSDGSLSDSASTTVSVSAPPAPAPDGLIARWALDDGGGSVATDSAGDHDGQLVNGPGWTGGQLGGGLRFDGSDDHVDLGSFPLSGSAVTVAAWIRPGRLDGTFGEGRILSQADGVSGSRHVIMLSPYPMNGGGIGVRFRLRVDGSTRTLVASSGGIDAGRWTHVAATFDGSAMRVYQDGAPVGSQGASGAISGSASIPLWLGGNPSGATDRPFDGIIDEVRVYDRALEADEIDALAAPVSNG